MKDKRRQARETAMLLPSNLSAPHMLVRLIQPTLNTEQELHAHLSFLGWKLVFLRKQFQGRTNSNNISMSKYSNFKVVEFIIFNMYFLLSGMLNLNHKTIVFFN